MNDRLRALVFNGLRLAFRMAPLSTATRDRLRQRFLTRHAGLVPEGPTGRPALATVIRPHDHASHPFIGYVPRRPHALPAELPATIVAFYLPQFHPIPENDAWWGKGFTEWTNVARALPQFEGHVQPRLPGSLGYYDLRLPDAMRQQMALAREYGVGAFCTYFYWFAGKTLLEAPLRQWLEDATLDLPICLCWANENWSRRWDGRAGDILIGQKHSPDDDVAFIEYVSAYLRDPRYLRVEGKPMLLVYRPGLLPNAAATAKRWRDWCGANGIGEIHLAYVQSFDNIDPSAIGFDAAVAFPPNNTSLKPVTAGKHLVNPDYKGEVLDWRELVSLSAQRKQPGYRLYPGVNPGWDNEARRSGRGRSYVHATPRAFSSWVRAEVTFAKKQAPAAPLVFVNAWNEWAEGAVLEPDVKHGYAWLDGIRRALLPEAIAPSRPCAVIHVWYVELLEALLDTLHATGLGFRVVLTVPREREGAVRDELQRLQSKAEVMVFENRGRDILPFLIAAARLHEEGEDVVLKLHTKRSTHRDDGAAWRTELVDRLASPARAAAVTRAFRDRPQLGFVAPEGHLLAINDYPGANKALVEYLLSLIGTDVAEAATGYFIAGSMFWCRLDALAAITGAPLSAADFALEQGQIDGTMAHAMERVVAIVAATSGFRTETAAAVIGDPEVGGPYPYAQQG